MMLSAMLLGMSLTVQVPPATAELVASVSAAKAQEPFLAAIILRTQPGWHVYWQNPGDTGTPTTVEWQLPEGWTASDLRWPVPQRFSDQDMVSFGYEGSTLLLATITPGPKPNAGPASIRATVSWLACKETCIAGTKELRLSLTMMPVKSGPHRTWFDRLALAEQSMPSAAENWTISAEVSGGGFLLKAKPPEGTETTKGLPMFYSSEAGVLELAEPQRFQLQEDGSLWLGMKKSSFLDKEPERLKGILVAPRGTRWPGDLEAIVVDVPLVKPEKTGGNIP